LTVEERLRKTRIMRVLGSAIGGTALKRLAAVLSLIAVFFLPLHFHSLAAPAKIAKECACAQGTRTKLAPVAPPPAHAPIISARLIIVRTSTPVSVEWPSFVSVRAPPATLSV
jgi:hypothetical protein